MFQCFGRVHSNTARRRWAGYYRLVHGNVVRLSQEVAVNHAWIEEIDFVYELSGEHKILFSNDGYYEKE